MNAELDSLRKLPLAEKLRVVEALWDDIAASPEPFPLQEWRRQEADRRLADLKADSSEALTCEQLWRLVDGVDEPAAQLP